MSIALDKPLLDNTAETPGQRQPLVLGGMDYAGLTDKVAGIIEQPRISLGWWVGIFLTAPLALGLLPLTLLYLFIDGVGVWGLNNPVSWGFDITNFVFWIGIGHAGTLISAILFLFRQKWRTSINRAAEAMTIFAVICAGIFPAVHVGRIWVVYWLFPLPSQRIGMWPQFRSPLLWDVFAVSTYFTVSAMFWYMGMLPDLATLRDRARGIRRKAYAILALGWNGSNRHWHRFERTYLILAALATPLVLSVHSVVSFDFATSQLPGWHTTIFPPYFVAGAIFGGFAMVNLLLVPCRSILGLHELITMRHIENMNKIILATGTIVGYAYAMEFFIAWYSGNPYELYAFLNRAAGPYAWSYWSMITCNVLFPQLFWFKFARQSLFFTMLVATAVTIGMWFERFVIIVTSLHRDFIPGSWGNYSPTWVEVAMFIGSMGLFMFLFLLFVRFLPMIAVAEVKTVLAHEQHERGVFAHVSEPKGYAVAGQPSD